MTAGSKKTETSAPEPELVAEMRAAIEEYPLENFDSDTEQK